MDRRNVLRGAAALAGPLLAGCTGNSGGGGEDGGMATATPTTTETPTGGTSTTTAGAATVVEMKNTSFVPARAEVNTGATVKWVNRDSFEHDVTSAQFHDEAASWNVSKTVASGESVTHTFDSSGVYEYYCTIHGKSTMCGAILVGGASLDKSLPCESGGGSTATPTDDGYY